MILMHNATGGNPATVEALPAIIRYYRSHGYSFVDLYGHTGHPVIHRISPASGPPRGRTQITITGHGFLGVRAVLFGTVEGRSVKVESSRRLTVVSPIHPLGRVHVRVTTTFGTSPASAADVYRYTKNGS